MTKSPSTQSPCFPLADVPWAQFVATSLLVAAAILEAGFIDRQREDAKQVFDALNQVYWLQGEKNPLHVYQPFDSFLVALLVVFWVATGVAVLGTVATWATNCATRVTLFNYGIFGRKASWASFLTSRVLLNVILAVSYIATAVCTALIFVQALLLASFHASALMCETGGEYENVVQRMNNGTFQSAADVTLIANQLGQSISTFDAVCGTMSNATQCRNGLAQLGAINATLVDKVQPWVASGAISKCNLDCFDPLHVWYLPPTPEYEQPPLKPVCLCKLDLLGSAEGAATDGIRASVSAAFVTILAFFVWLLYYGLVAMNIKSFLKDHQWMRLESESDSRSL